LNAVRAFEAAARHQNITKAGEELGVSHGAVSRQIKLLEATLGVTLFDRESRRVVLTEVGRQCAEQVSLHLQGLAEAFEGARGVAERPSLTVAVNSDLATLWLAPRLADFAACCPEVTINFQAERELTFLPEAADCAIGFGDGNWGGCNSDYLFGDSLFVVAAPALIEGAPGLTSPGDLDRHALLHFRDHREWVKVARALGRPRMDVHRGPVFNLVSLLIGAVTSGEGVSVGDLMTMRQSLDTGSLRVPFRMFVPDTQPYYFLFRERAAGRPALRLFRDWLHVQFDEHRAWAARFQAELLENGGESR
jgi:LysR family glycine cleavage system transcriptional activator